LFARIFYLEPILFSFVSFVSFYASWIQTKLYNLADVAVKILWFLNSLLELKIWKHLFCTNTYLLWFLFI